MSDAHVISVLRNKRSELAGVLLQLEHQLVQHRANLSHLDATMQLFDPDIRPKEISAKVSRARSAWFRNGECLRLLYDALRDAARPLTSRELAERVMHVKVIGAADERQRELVQKAILGSLNRAKETIERVVVAGVVSWRLR